MTINYSLVSIIIPCRNEEKYIGKCLDSIIQNQYPKDKLEVLVIDGNSEDKTREIVKNYTQGHSFIKLLDNPKKFTPLALNIGVQAAKGEIIMRMDAHATYEKDYISKCLKYLQEYKVDNVGGVIKTLPGQETTWAKAIAISLSHLFGTGGSYFRTGAKESKEVDTVFGGCYKKEVFEKIGLFNENLIRSQDIEFNLRLKKAGGKILLVPDIVSYYYPKSNLKDFFWHNVKDGLWSIYPLKFVKVPFSFRHYIPLVFVLSLLITGLLGIFLPVFSQLFLFIIGLYVLLTFCFSIQISLREKDIRFLLFMPLAFVARHIGYGLGSMEGLIKLI